MSLGDVRRPIRGNMDGTYQDNSGNRIYLTLRFWAFQPRGQSDRAEHSEEFPSAVVRRERDGCNYPSQGQKRLSQSVVSGFLERDRNGLHPFLDLFVDFYHGASSKQIDDDSIGGKGELSGLMA